MPSIFGDQTLTTDLDILTQAIPNRPPTSYTPVHVSALNGNGWIVLRGASGNNLRKIDVLEAMPDGRGVLMLDGKMQDDATWKQCKVMVSLAELLAKKDPALAEAYGL